jgi:hypothetical protein
VIAQTGRQTYHITELPTAAVDSDAHRSVDVDTPAQVFAREVESFRNAETEKRRSVERENQRLRTELKTVFGSSERTERDIGLGIIAHRDRRSG